MGNGPVLQIDLVNSEIRQRFQLVWLTDAIMIGVDPYPQFRIHGVSRVNEAIAVAAVSRLVVDGQSQKAVGILAGRLGVMLPNN